jgi:hypothetical protein
MLVGSFCSGENEIYIALEALAVALAFVGSSLFLVSFGVYRYLLLLCRRRHCCRCLHSPQLSAVVLCLGRMGILLGLRVVHLVGDPSWG